MSTELIEFGDSEGIRRAAQIVAEGGVIGIYVDGVATVWVDGRQSHAAARIEAIKGEGRVGKPLSAILEAEALVPLIDLDRVPQPLRVVFGSPETLAARLGALGGLRLPLCEAGVGELPTYMFSQSADGVYWVQDFIPNGHPTTTLLVRELARAGVMLPAATSMNVSGMPEIADQDEALAFSHQHEIPVFLHDPHPNPHIRGSFPILGIGPDGVAVLREGHFPGQLFRKLLEFDAVDLSQAKPARYPISAEIRERFERTELRGAALRAALLAFVHDEI